MSEPIYQDKEDNKWYFWNEIEVDRYGPYKSEKEARLHLAKYTEFLEEGRIKDD